MRDEAHAEPAGGGDLALGLGPGGDPEGGAPAPPREIRQGLEGAAAPPSWLTRARNVRGPTFSERIRRSQSRRCVVGADARSSLLPDPALAPGEEPPDVLPVLAPEQERR